MWWTTPGVPSSAVLSQFGRWSPPSEELARLKQRDEVAHHATLHAALATPLQELKSLGGVGHMLYLRFLRWNALLFLMLALFIGLPQILANVRGGFYATADLEATSLGNFGLVSSSEPYQGRAMQATSHDTEATLVAMFRNDTAPPDDDFPWLPYVYVRKDVAIIIMSSIDILGVIAYFICCVLMSRAVGKLAEEADDETITLHDYSVMVRGLPEDATTAEVQLYFSRYGKVADVELMRACGRLLHLFVRRKRVAGRWEMAVARLQRAAEAADTVPARLLAAVEREEALLLSLSDQIRYQQVAHGGNRVVAAVVTFEDASSKASCIAALPGGLLGRFATARRPAAQRFRGTHVLQALQAPEPTDIKYENLEHGVLSRTGFMAASTAIKYLALLAGFVAINLAPALRYKVVEDMAADEAACAAAGCDYYNSQGALELSAANRQLYESCHKTGLEPDGVTPCAAGTATCFDCYCRTALNAMLWTEAKYCGLEYASVFSAQAGSQSVIVISIILINALLGGLASHLSGGGLEKHRTRTGEARSLTRQLFFALFLNTAVSTLVANIWVPKVQAILERSGGPWRKILLAGIYSDLTPTWYKQVGRPLAFSLIVGAFMRPCWLLCLVAWRRLTLAVRRGGLLTQSQMDDVVKAPAFSLADRYAERLQDVFVCLLFASGMPIMYFIGCFIFVLSYVVEKAELLKLSRRPIAHDDDLARLVARLQPWAAVFHLAFGAWAYSLFRVRQAVPPSSGGDENWFTWGLRAMIVGAGPLWTGFSDLTPDQVAERLLQVTGLPQLVTLLATGAAMLAILTTYFGGDVARALANAFGCRRCCGFGPSPAAVVPVDETGAPVAKAQQEQRRSWRRRQHRQRRPSSSSASPPLSSSSSSSCGTTASDNDDDGKDSRAGVRSGSDNGSAGSSSGSDGGQQSDDGSDAPPLSYSEALAAGELVGPKTYDIRRNSEYAHAFLEIDRSLPSRTASFTAGGDAAAAVRDSKLGGGGDVVSPKACGAGFSEDMAASLTRGGLWASQRLSLGSSGGRPGAQPRSERINNGSTAVGKQQPAYSAVTSFVAVDVDAVGGTITAAADEQGCDDLAGQQQGGAAGNTGGTTSGGRQSTASARSQAVLKEEASSGFESLDTPQRRSDSSVGSEAD